MLELLSDVFQGTGSFAARYAPPPSMGDIEAGPVAPADLGKLARPAVPPPQPDAAGPAPSSALDAFVTGDGPRPAVEPVADPLGVAASGKAAGALVKAMDGLGTDEDAIFKTLKGRTPAEIASIKAAYKKASGKDLDEALKDELSGSELSRATAMMNPETGAPAAGKDGKKLDPEAVGKSANELFKAMDGIGTDEKAIFKTLQGKSPAEIAAIKAEYRKAKGRDLDTDLKDELSGDELKRAEALVKGDTRTAALEALKDAKALVGTTDPEKVKEALAILPNPADLEDPKEREKAIEERRKLLSEAGIESGREEAKGVAATAAKYAVIGSIIPGVGTLVGGIVGGIVGAVEGDKDAKQNNKMLEAVIAGDDDKLAGEQIEKELHGGLFGHGGFLGIGLGRDEGKIESSLENARDPKKVAEAYKAATGKELKEDLQGRLSGDDKDVTVAMLDTHDKDPAKAAAARAQVAAAKIHRAKDGAGTDEDGIYKQLEGARSDAERKAIVKAYNDRYKDKEGMDFDSMLKDELSGNDLTKAQQLEARGKLDPEFALKYAMDGAGTDTKLILETFKGKSKKEIDGIIARYDRENAPRTFKEDMKGELKISGRDGFDIKQALEGDPETIKDPTERAKAKIARANAAYDFERGSGAGVLTKAVDVFSDSGRVMDEHHEEMVKLGEKMKEGKPLSAEDQKQINELTRYAKDDQEDFRAARDSVSNTAATATSAVVAATVGVLIEVATAGAATPALIAAVSALAGGAASMGVKYGVQGASYGTDQIATDAAMTLIQAATAGFGQTGKFMEIAGKVPGLKELATTKVGQEMLKQAFMSAAGQGAGALMNQDTYRGEGNGALKVLGAFGSGAVSGAVTGAILGGTNARFGSGYLAGGLGGAAAGVVQTALEVGANPDEEWGNKLAMNLFTNVSGGLISAAGHQAREHQEAMKAAAGEEPLQAARDKSGRREPTEKELAEAEAYARRLVEKLPPHNRPEITTYLDEPTAFHPIEDRVNLGEDLAPAKNLKKVPKDGRANAAMSPNASVAHEIVGHRAARQQGMNADLRFPGDRATGRAVEEAQASFRAAMAEGLTTEQRMQLIRDGKERLAGRSDEVYIYNDDLKGGEQKAPPATRGAGPMDEEPLFVNRNAGGAEEAPAPRFTPEQQTMYVRFLESGMTREQAQRALIDLAEMEASMPAPGPGENQAGRVRYAPGYGPTPRIR